MAFHREKFQQYGPPSGGNGGRGGDIYIQPTSHLTTLSSVPRRVRGNAGGTGLGTFQSGRAGEPTIIRVPLGTIVRELPRGDPRRQPDEWEALEAELLGLETEDRQAEWRRRRFIHFPNYEDNNVARAAFKDAVWELMKMERDMRRARRERDAAPLQLDLNVEDIVERPADSPLGLPHAHNHGTLIASGGAGGFGNPHFLGGHHRSPKFATRGYDGERVTLELELKILADIGFVGMPNAGKSTLLRALTVGRAKSEIASYAFTTLNPFVGVVRVAVNGELMGGSMDQVYDDTIAEEEREREMMESGELANARSRNQELNDSLEGSPESALEDFRFTIADNPGLIAEASENVGLGHSFLRSMERSLALVYVVDLSGNAPWDELRVLKDELEKYQAGMSSRARMVIANKADLFDGTNSEAVAEARTKLEKLEEVVHEEFGQLDVVPTSGKYSQNLKKVVRLMRQYVEQARAHSPSGP